MTTENTTELATIDTQSGEMAVSAQQAMARHEIEGALIMAHRMPRNEDAAFGKIAKACERFVFAGSALYSYPRGGHQIEGPSVNLARLMGRCWGNIRSGFDIIHDDDDVRTVRGWAWDLESNTKEHQDATFRKLVQRKKKGKSGGTEWVKPDERDLRELNNKHGAICVRNCLLHLMPPDFVEEAERMCKETVRNGISEDADDHRRKMIRAFGGLGVRPEEIEEHLGHPLAQASPDEIVELRGIYKSIADGNSIWSDYTSEKKNTPVSDDLTPKPKALPKPKAVKPQVAEPPEPEPKQLPDQQELRTQYSADIAKCNTVAAVDAIAKRAKADADLDDDSRFEIVSWTEERISEI